MKGPIPTAERKFLYAVDDSTRSKKGLDILLKLVRPKDTLALVHFYSRDSDLEYLEGLKTYFESELNSVGPVSATYQAIEEEVGVAITSTIANYSNQYNPDFFVIAPRATITISTVSVYVVNHVSASVIFVKV